MGRTHLINTSPRAHVYTHAELMLDDHHNNTKLISRSTYCVAVNLNSGGDFYNTSTLINMSQYIYNVLPIVQYYVYVLSNELSAITVAI